MMCELPYFDLRMLDKRSIERMSCKLSHSWMLIDDTRRGQSDADTNRSRPSRIYSASSSALPFRRVKSEHIYQIP
jgi:hypothetical protein